MIFGCEAFKCLNITLQRCWECCALGAVTTDGLSRLGLESCGSQAKQGHIPLESPPFFLHLVFTGQPQRVGSRSGLAIVATDPHLLSRMSGKGGSRLSMLLRSAFRFEHLALGRLEKGLKTDGKPLSRWKTFPRNGTGISERVTVRVKSCCVQETPVLWPHSSSAAWL